MTTSQNKFDEDNSQALNDLNGVKYDTYNNNISRSVINSNFLTNNITYVRKWQKSRGGGVEMLM